LIDLKEVLADHIAGFELESFANPLNLLCNGLFLEIRESELTVGSETAECGFVEITIGVAHPHENVLDDEWLNSLEKFVCLHGDKWVLCLMKVKLVACYRAATSTR